MREGQYADDPARCRLLRGLERVLPIRRRPALLSICFPVEVLVGNCPQPVYQGVCLDPDSWAKRCSTGIEEIETLKAELRDRALGYLILRTAHIAQSSIGYPVEYMLHPAYMCLDQDAFPRLR